MKINSIEDFEIPDSFYVTVTEMNHIIEVQHMQKKNTQSHIQKIDKKHYVDKRDGEIKEFKLSENRSQNINSLRQTFKKLRYLINNNFSGSANELFLTLTYRGELQTNDHLKVGDDYKKFLKRLKRAYKDISTIDALKVLEPHASGNYHMHVLIRFNDLDNVFIPNSTCKITGESINAPLRDIWGLGNVTIRSLSKVDNIGAYMSAYMTDLEVPDNYKGSSEVEEKEVDGKKKKFIKGGRLVFYPTGVNLYTKTKGILYPERKEMTYKEAKKNVVQSAKLNYKKTIEINDENKKFSNTITYEQYNLKRH